MKVWPCPRRRIFQVHAHGLLLVHISRPARYSGQLIDAKAYSTAEDVLRRAWALNEEDRGVHDVTLHLTLTLWNLKKFDDARQVAEEGLLRIDRLPQNFGKPYLQSPASAPTVPAAWYSPSLINSLRPPTLRHLGLRKGARGEFAGGSER